ncbi:MAG: ABC transporter permease, partial [Longimicrobiales bacterium]
MGACTAMSAVIYRLLLVPMPYDGGERMGYPWLAMEEGGMSVTPRRAVVEAWAEGARTIEWLERFASDDFILTGQETPEALSGGYLSATLAPRLGVRPVLGRYLVPDDAQTGREKVVLLDDGFWRRRYGADRGVLGQRIMMNGDPYTIVGVMPSHLANFMEVGSARDVWVPFPSGSAEDFVNVLLKRREGVDVEAAEAELNEIAARVAEANPLPGRWRTHIRGADYWLGAATRRALMVLSGAVGVVLLIACANVAGLLLARGESRRKEIAIRAALGAGRRRLLRHLSAESVLLALFGGGLGLLLATWALGLVRAVRPHDFEALDAVTVQPIVLAFCVVLSIGAAALFGIAPALTTLRTSFAETMKGTSGSTGAASSLRLRSAMVTAQIALSTILLVSAVLLIQTVVDLQRRPLGFRPEGLLKARLSAPESRYPTDQARDAFFRSILEGIEALPGVASAAFTTGVPPGFGMGFGELEIEGRQLESPSRTFPAASVHAAFFATLGLGVVEGRTFADKDANADVVVINRAMARKYWPGEGVVGKRLRFSEAGPWQTIIGVVSDVATGGPASRLDTEQIYSPMSLSYGSQTLLVRVREGDPALLAPALRALVAHQSPDSAPGRFHGGGAPIALDLPRPVQHDAADCIRRGRARACVHRDLRVGGFLGRSTHTRDRRAHG